MSTVTVIAPAALRGGVINGAFGSYTPNVSNGETVVDSRDVGNMLNLGCVVNPGATGPTGATGATGPTGPTGP